MKSAPRLSKLHLALASAIFLTACGGEDDIKFDSSPEGGTPTPVVTPTPSPGMTPTPTPAVTPTPSPGMTPTPTPVVTPTPSPGMTPTPTPVVTPTPSPGITPTPTPVVTPTPTPVVTPTPTPTPSVTPTPTPTPSVTPTPTPTPSVTPTPTPTPVATPTPSVDPVILQMGQDEYQAQCSGCHAPDGTGDGFPAIDNTKSSFSHSSDPGTQLSLVDYIDQYMGTFAQPSNCTIDNGCAEPVTAYILNNFSVDGVQAVPEAERLERVTKGENFYRDPTVNCIVCHGNDGTKSVGIGKSLENCDVCNSWTSLVNYIDEFMPQEPEGGSTETGPFICSIENECATYTADWIWNTVNNWTLTADGGERIETEDRYGQDTQRLKSYSMLTADYQRVFGAIPANLAASATAFKASPEYWYEEPEMGAVALNVLANSAVQACENETLPAINQSALTTSCTNWAQRMWLRDPSDSEIESCVAVGLEDTADLDDRDRAIFTCVSVMISLPALTY